MALDFKEIMSAANVAGYYAGTQRDIKNHPLLALFPPKKIMTTELSYIVGANNTPVALRASNYDAMPPVRDRLSATIKRLELPFFREQMDLKEKDRKDLMIYAQLGDGYVRQALAEISTMIPPT
jgi:hypothetical protein